MDQEPTLLPPVVDPNSARALLSARELEVALMLARGDTNKEIAVAINIQQKTVDTHRRSILKKLDCKNNAKLTLRLVREGLVLP